MIIKNLSNTSLSVIAATFNAAFSDYMVRLELTEEGLSNKIKAENINLGFSVGAFIDNKLIGFILMGLRNAGDAKIAYNAGTGVIPEFRGNGIAEKLYEHIFSSLKDEGYIHHQLEVIETNERALRVYKRLGFNVTRTFSCFKGKVNVSKLPTIEIRELKGLDWDRVERFWNVQPSWQNSTIAIKNTPERHRIIGAFKGDELVGYIAFSGERLKQFGVAEQHRRQGIGSALFRAVNEQTSSGELNFINFDVSDSGSISFFNQIGLTRYIGLYEMRLIVESPKFKVESSAVGHQ